ncbi:MAG: efflux RND transporter periplasmic adaptor subunit [Muribaculaceae bacterium]|nr:efflux RND transporter periplasmic adaptor subunit [Muribaculaceae bacterium]
MANTVNNNESEVKQRESGLIVAVGIIIVAVLLLALAGFLFMDKPAEIIEGQAEATTVKVSGKLPGRVLEFYVSEGDRVKKGDTLVHIHSSIAQAKMNQAKAMEVSTAAQNKKIDAGARSQVIQGAYEILQQATAARVIAEKTYQRMENLFQGGVISEQKRDEAKAAFDAAKAAEGAAAQQYSLAKAGAQQEDKTSAAAMVEVARGGVQEVEAVLEDEYLTAPCDGQIEEIYPEVGELVSIGAPIMTVLQLDKKYITFNVREEFLKDMKMDGVIEVMIPALNKMKTKVKIYYINDMGTYATWRATKNTGQWDSRTFEVKARTLDNVPDLRPGMTVVYYLEKPKAKWSKSKKEDKPAKVDKKDDKKVDKAADKKAADKKATKPVAKKTPRKRDKR